MLTDQAAGQLSIDPDENYVIVPVSPVHPQILAGERLTKSYWECFTKGGMYVRFLQVPLAGGEVTTIYEEKGIGCNHCQHCPTDPDLLLIDRDLPPQRRNEQSRIWLLRLSTGKLKELAPHDERLFQVHSTWTWDGKNIIYHGPSAKGGWYIGIIGRNGKVLQEYCFSEAKYYGHVVAMAKRPAIIFDGNISEDLLMWLYYDQKQPRIEIIARHGSDFMGMPWQYCHPHPLSDPTGQWISFNAVRRDCMANRGRSDVFIVKV